MSTTFVHKEDDRVEVRREDGTWVSATIVAVDTTDKELPYRVQYSPDQGSMQGWVNEEIVRAAPTVAEAPTNGQTPAMVPTVLETARAELESTRRALVGARNELATFKIQVREKAIEIAKEQDWCHSGLNEALSELGLEEHQTETTVTFEVTATWRVSAKIATADGVDEDLILNSLDLTEVGMDGDWTDVEVNDADISISNIDESEG